MQKAFFSNLAIMVLLNLLVKPLAIIGIDAAVQNRVGDEAYGIYFSLLNFSVLFNILLDFGINNFTTKHIAQTPEVAAKYLGKILTFRFVLFIFYAIVSFTIALVLGWNSYELYLLGFLVLNQFLIALIAYVRSYFGGFLLFRTDAFIGVLDRILLIVFCGAVLYFPISDQPITIEWFIWIQTICYVLALIVALILLFMRLGVPKLRYRPVLSYAIIRKSLPYALLILLMMIYSRVDSVMIERMRPDGKLQAGYYAKGFRLLSALFMFAMLFSNLLFPMFSRMLKDKTNILPLLHTSGKLLVGGSIVVAAITWFNSEYILGLIYSKQIQESDFTFQLLMLSFVGMCATVIYGTLLTARGDLRFLNIISAAGIIVNFVINYLLIPDYGAEGAAVATLITQSAVSLLQFVYCVRALSIRFLPVPILLFVLFTVSVTTLCYYIRAENATILLGLMAAGLILMFLFRMIDLRAVLRMMKTGEE